MSTAPAAGSAPPGAGAGCAGGGVGAVGGVGAGAGAPGAGTAEAAGEVQEGLRDPARYVGEDEVGHHVGDLAEAGRELAKVPSGHIAQILVWRGDGEAFVTVKKD